MAVFVPDKPLQPSLMFVGKAGAYPIAAPLYTLSKLKCDCEA
jgi:hypothetical protein